MKNKNVVVIILGVVLVLLIGLLSLIKGDEQEAYFVITNLKNARVSVKIWKKNLLAREYQRKLTVELGDKKIEEELSPVKPNQLELIVYATSPDSILIRSDSVLKGIDFFPLRFSEFDPMNVLGLDEQARFVFIKDKWEYLPTLSP